MELTALTVPQLLKTHVGILEELRRREIVRTSNSPGSDLAEILFCRAFGWKRENNSASGHDATDAAGVRYQIKGRRLSPFNKSRQMGGIRNLHDTPFDQLAGILFDRDYEILRAALVPFLIVKDCARRSDHTNSWKFHLRDAVWSLPGVVDVTSNLRLTAARL